MKNLKAILLGILLTSPLVMAADVPTEINVKAQKGQYEFYLRESSRADHFQINRSLSDLEVTPKGTHTFYDKVINKISKGEVGIRHAQGPRGSYEELRLILDYPLYHAEGSLGHFEVDTRVEFRDFNSQYKSSEFRSRLILEYTTPSLFTVEGVSVSAWAKLQPRVAKKSQDDSRNQLGLLMAHNDLPFTVAPFVESYRNEDLNHVYRLIGVNVEAKL